MPMRYKEAEALQYIERYARLPQEFALRIYTSHLIGSDPALVLHGGGNTSVKIRQPNLFGEMEDVLFIKGSGHDLAAIEPEGFAGLVLHPLRKLRDLTNLSDEQMIQQLDLHRTSVDAPSPSVEALLHAFLPHAYVDHTHADSILVLTHQPGGEALVQQALGPLAAVLPYEMSGLPLARSVIAAVEKNPDLQAVVVMNHGIFAFAEDARTAYERMIQFVARADAFIAERIRKSTPSDGGTAAGAPSTDRVRADLLRCAQVVRGACIRPGADGRLYRVHAVIRTTPELIAASLGPKAVDICRSGVLTPDHAIRTKNKMVYIDGVPAEDAVLQKNVAAAVDAFRKDYRYYYDRHQAQDPAGSGEFNPDPVVFLVAGAGLIAVAPTLEEAHVAADIAEHSICAKQRAWQMGSYTPMPESQVFHMEFWRLQQRKRRRSGRLLLQGQAALVTGAGGAIGYGIADRLLAAGAGVALSDIDRERLGTVHALLCQKYGAGALARILCDVTDPSAVEAAYEAATECFGGVDIVVPNAGVALVSRIENLDPADLDKVMAVNFKGTFTVIKGAVPVFRRQGTGGNIVVISTKNVFDPGAAFGAYSASKAAAHQLAKIAALELADLKVRVNMVCPDAVFGDENVCSKLWEEGRTGTDALPGTRRKGPARLLLPAESAQGEGVAGARRQRRRVFRQRVDAHHGGRRCRWMPAISSTFSR